MGYLLKKHCPTLLQEMYIVLVVFSSSFQEILGLLQCCKMADIHTAWVCFTHKVKLYMYLEAIVLTICMQLLLWTRDHMINRMTQDQELQVLNGKSTQQNKLNIRS